MKKKLLMLVVVLVVVGLCASTAFAVGHIGPPTAGLNKGQWSGGFNYSYSSQDLDKTSVKWKYFEDGVLDESGKEKLKMKDVKTQRYYGTIGYGIDNCWELNVSLGVADVKANAKFTDEDGETWKQGFNFDNDFAWGLGTKVTFAKQDKIDWGVAVQMNWLNTSWSEKLVEEDESEKIDVDVETYDLVLAVGPTVDMGGWKLYGGPFYYYLSGDYTEKAKGSDEDGSWLEKGSGDLRADNNFGGYIGAQFELAQNCNATIECSSTGDGWGLGTGITFKF